MRKSLIFTFIIALCIGLSVPGFSGGGDNRVHLKYPVVLIHGWAGSNVFLGSLEYFYGIHSYLEDNVKVSNCADRNGVFVADTVNAFNTDSIRGPQLRQYILSVLAATGAARVNVIGHSMGGTTARYMVWAFSDMKARVASVSTVATPHRGTSAANLILLINSGSMGSLQWVMDNFWGKLVSGDSQSRFIAATQQLTPASMASFNQLVTNASGVSYFSYADKYYGISPAPFNNILYPFYAWMRDREGDNDGVVPVSSMSWGEYRGVSTGLFGCDHGMIVNQLLGFTPGFDAKGFYRDVCEFLESRGL